MQTLRQYGTCIAAAAVLLCCAADFASAAAPDIELILNCPELRYVGRDATFEVTVANKGDAPAYNVVVTDILPKGLEYRTADSEGKFDGSNVVWRVGALEPGQSHTFKTTLTCPTIGKYRNAARVVYCVEASQECELEVKGIPAILLECVDDPDPIEVGNSVNYTITVTNQGSAIGTNIVLTCTLPAELEYVTSKGPTAGAVDGSKITFAPLPTLAPKAKAVYLVTAKGVGEGDVRFQVEMMSDQIDTHVMETESTHVYN